MAREFVEVSPKGEVDERLKVVSFYSPEKKSPAPPYIVSESKVRISGDTAVITQVVTIGQAPRVMRLTQLLTANRSNKKWLLTSSQSTPQPPQATGK